MTAPTMKQKPIDEATPAELKDFAMIKGLDVHDNLKDRKRLIALIRTVHTGEMIDVRENSQPAPLQAGSTETAGTKKSKGTFDVKNNYSTPGDFKGLPKVKVNIAKSEQAGGDRHVFLAVNGAEFLVQRGEPVDIPYPVYEALKNAVEWKYFQDQETREMKKVEVPRYPFQVLSIPEGLAA